MVVHTSSVPSVVLVSPHHASLTALNQERKCNTSQYFKMPILRIYEHKVLGITRKRAHYISYSISNTPRHKSKCVDQEITNEPILLYKHERERERPLFKHGMTINTKIGLHVSRVKYVGLI